MDLNLILNIDKAAEKKKKKVKQDNPEYELIFKKYRGQVPSNLISSLAKKKGVDREFIRIFFHNRRTKERQILLRSYKTSILKLRSALNANFQFESFEEVVNYLTHMQIECKHLIESVDTFYVGKYYATDN